MTMVGLAAQLSYSLFLAQHDVADVAR
jgi:hypothetical protein